MGEGRLGLVDAEFDSLTNCWHLVASWQTWHPATKVDFDFSTNLDLDIYIYMEVVENSFNFLVG